MFENEIGTRDIARATFIATVMNLDINAKILDGNTKYHNETLQHWNTQTILLKEILYELKKMDSKN
jgi:hypothetical protein